MMNNNEFIMKNLKYILILLLLVPFSCIDDKSKFGVLR